MKTSLLCRCDYHTAMCHSASWQHGTNTTNINTQASRAAPARKGIRPVKYMGEWWRWALVSPDGVAPTQTVGVSASVNLPLHHKVQRFSSSTVSSGWSQKKGRKTVVVVVVSKKFVIIWRNLLSFIGAGWSRSLWEYGRHSASTIAMVNTGYLTLRWMSHL